MRLGLHQRRWSFLAIASCLAMSMVIAQPTIIPSYAAKKPATVKAAPAFLQDYEIESSTRTLRFFFTAPLNQAKMVPIYQKGERVLFIDIRGASLGGISPKLAAFNQALTQAFPEVEKATVAEFKGEPSLVRIWIKMATLDQSATYKVSQGNTRLDISFQPQAKIEAVSKANRDKGIDTAMVAYSPPKATSGKNVPQPNGNALQTLGSSSAAVPDTWNWSKLSAAEPAPNQPEPVTPSTEPTAEPVLLKDTQYSSAFPTTNSGDEAVPITGQDNVDIAHRSYKQKAFEAESLRFDRNRWKGQVKDLNIAIQQRDEIIAKLKREQQLLLQKDNDAKRKQRIENLQYDLSQLQKSYEQLTKDYQLLQAQHAESSEKATMLAQSQQAQSDALAKQNSALTNEFASAKVRGSFLNTLSQLSKPEVDQLVDAEAAYREGRKAEQKGDFKTAEEKYRVALRLAPQVSEYSLALSALLIEQKRFDDAKVQLQEALRYQPDEKNLLNELAKLYLMEKNVSAALELLRRALPTDTMSNYASALRRANKLEDAEALYKATITANPGDSDLHYNLGTLYLSQKRYNDSEDRFEEAVRLNPNFAEAHYQLGLVYAELGSTQKAIDQLEAYLQLLPDAANAQSVRRYIQDLTQVMSPPSISTPSKY